jgi:hypothetical protein
MGGKGQQPLQTPKEIEMKSGQQSSAPSSVVNILLGDRERGGPGGVPAAAVKYPEAIGKGPRGKARGRR